MITSISERAKVGVMVCGHKEYWPQFPGMRERLAANGEEFTSWIRDADLVDVAGSIFVETPEGSVEAGLEFKKQDIELLFVFLTSYVASGRFVQGALMAGCPIVLVAGQRYCEIHEDSEITSYETTAMGEACPLPEAYSAFVRAGKRPAGVLFGILAKNEYFATEIERWCRAANAVHAFKGSVFGYMGHSYEGMLDMNFDPTAVTREFGAHVRFVEMCELVNYVNDCTDAELQAKLDQINDTFVRMDKSYDTTTMDICEPDVEWAARVSVGLDKLVQNNGLSGFAYYYVGGQDNLYQRVASNLMIGNSLMTTNGIAMAGEADMKTCLAMYLTSALGCGGSFCELHLTDFDKDVLLVGHDGPHDIRISDKKPTLRGLSLFHGKQGYGVSVEFSIKHGPITMVSLGSDENGRFQLIYAEGESQSGWVPPMGNTVTRGYFGKDVCQFIRDWSSAGTTHHASLCIGHCGSMLERFGAMTGIKVVKVR